MSSWALNPKLACVVNYILIVATFFSFIRIAHGRYIDHLDGRYKFSVQLHGLNSSL